ncbi:MAG: shikimate dehydrogenase [Rhodoglobus sp.]
MQLADPQRTHLAVLGSPIAHSKSPAIHRAAYAALGLDWSYESAEVTGDTLAEYVGSRGVSWRGLSLTMPLKRDILPLLSSRDALVDRVGGANTVLLTDEGPRGFNTDVQGVVESFLAAGVESLHSVQLLGAGATAASVLVAVASMGASRAIVSARTPAKAHYLVELGDRLGLAVVVRPWGIADRSLVSPDAIISTVPGGENDLQFAEPIRQQSVLFDVAYDPWPSQLATAWAEVGGTVISGVDLLINQAVGQVRIFVGGNPTVSLPDESAVVAAMRAAVA